VKATLRKYKFLKVAFTNCGGNRGSRTLRGL